MTLNAFHQGYLSTSDGHEIYYEQYGNPKGTPVLWLHGGPGVGTHPSCRDLFDPEIFHAILVDQRGAGKSRPSGQTEHNTTQHLIDDFEQLRQMLGIKKWCLMGGSWGTTLALVYAQTHPSSISHLILRGVFLARDHDFNWLYHYGTSEFFPEEWKAFLAPIGGDNDNVIDKYHSLFNSKDSVIAHKAMDAWSTWEASVAKLRQDPAIIEQLQEPETCFQFATISNHYFINRCFLEPNQIIKNIGIIRSIPTWIVHGRYDLLCPVSGAYWLKQQLSECQLMIIEAAGHAQSEPGIYQALKDCLGLLINHKDDP